MLDAPLLDHLIRPGQQRRRNRQAKRLGGLEVDDEFKSCRLLNRKIGRPRTLANPGDIRGSTHGDRGYVWTERHEAAVVNNLSEAVDNGQPICCGEVDELSPGCIKQSARRGDQGLWPLLLDIGERAGKILGGTEWIQAKPYSKCPGSSR